MRGFSLMELLAAITILTVVAAIAIPVYRNYLIDAQTVDVLDTAAVLEEQLGILAVTEEGMLHLCDDQLASGGLGNDYLEQTIVPLPGGEAALAVVAKFDQHGGTGIAVATQLHEEFTGMGKDVDADVIGESLVSFRVRLTPAGQPFCDMASAAVASSTTPATPATPVATSGPAPKLVVTTQPPAATPDYPPSQIVVCGDENSGTKCTDLELVIADASVTCPASRPLGMNKFVRVGNSLSTYKRCASHDDCLRENPCPAGFDPDMGGPDLSCAFCCQGNGCNSNTIPHSNELWHPTTSASPGLPAPGAPKAVAMSTPTPLAAPDQRSTQD